MMMPVTISHKIDEDSPFYKMGPNELARANLEIIVVVEGVTEETGNTIQKRTSYLPAEILWGHRFENKSMVTFDKRINAYLINHNVLNKTMDDSTPKCSAMLLKSMSSMASSLNSTST